MSILENAIYQLIHFKENNRKIFITIKDTKDTIIIMIEDNAGGIKNKNFDELFHIDYSSKKNNGSGIGLALTKRLIENRLKGTIKAANTKTGAVFKIVFPKY
ncbi:ATP-binding protein [Malaciobacter mytili]|uniref:ATP-binding protein n=1 Tax=Malaciobacter mytili TaxID=603050 RepID=UPI003BB0E1B8